MKMTLQQVFDATPVLTTIINEKRPLPLKGSYRVMRMHAKLKPEYEPIAAKYDALLAEHAAAKEGEPGKYTVTPEFVAAWSEFTKDEIEVDVEPMPLACLDLGDAVAGSVSASELIVLGNLVTE